MPVDLLKFERAITAGEYVEKADIE